LTLAVSFAAAYTLWDWAVSFQTAFPIGRLGATLSGSPLWIQPAALVGPFALGFGVAFVNAAIAIIITQQHGVQEYVKISRLVGALVLTTGVWLFAGWNLLGIPRAISEELSIAVVQGSVTLEEYRAKVAGDESAARRIVDRYVRLTEPVLAGHDLTFWPETALWGYAQEREALDGLLASSDGKLIGGFPIRRTDGRGGILDLNTALYFENSATPSDLYAKHHLLPVFEPEFSPGEGPELVETERGAFATPICFEAVLTHYMKRLFEYRPAAVIVLSNDAGFGLSLVSYYMFKQAALNAASANKALVRAGQSGISAIVDTQGNVRSHTDLFEQTVLSGTIELSQNITPYVRFGDWSPLFSAMLLIIFGIFRFVREKWPPPFEQLGSGDKV